MQHDKMDDAGTKPVPAIGITFQHQLDDFRSIVLQGFVAADCPEIEFNAMLDKLRSASDRQKAAAHLPTIRGLLADKQAGLHQETKALFAVESERDVLNANWRKDWEASNRRGAFVMSPAQKQEAARIEQAHGKSAQNITVLQKEIAVYERQIADMEAKLRDSGE
jgi:hypothetical protein